MRPGSDQRINLRGGEMLQQSGDEVVDAVTLQIVRFDEGLVVGEAADIDAHFEAQIEGRRPPGLSTAHGHPERPDARRVHLRSGEQVVEAAQGVVDHHAP